MRKFVIAIAVILCMKFLPAETNAWYRYMKGGVLYAVDDKFVKLLTPNTKQEITIVYDRFAIIEDVKNRKYGVVGVDGSLILPLKWDYISFDEYSGFFNISKNKKTFLAKEDGTIIGKGYAASRGVFDLGNGILKISNGLKKKEEYRSLSGKKITEMYNILGADYKKYSIIGFNNRLYIVRHDQDKTYCLDTEGKVLWIKGGIAIGKYPALDFTYKGKLVLAFMYTKKQNDGSLSGLMDVDGNVMKTYPFVVSNFNGGIAQAWDEGGRAFYCDIDGRLLWNKQAKKNERFYPFYNGFATITVWDEDVAINQYVINSKGEIVMTQADLVKAYPQFSKDFFFRFESFRFSPLYMDISFKHATKQDEQYRLKMDRTGRLFDLEKVKGVGW